MGRRRIAFISFSSRSRSVFQVVQQSYLGTSSVYPYTTGRAIDAFTHPIHETLYQVSHIRRNNQHCSSPLAHFTHRFDEYEFLDGIIDVALLHCEYTIIPLSAKVTP